MRSEVRPNPAPPSARRHGRYTGPGGSSAGLVGQYPSVIACQPPPSTRPHFALDFRRPGGVGSQELVSTRRHRSGRPVALPALPRRGAPAMAGVGRTLRARALNRSDCLPPRRSLTSAAKPTAGIALIERPERRLRVSRFGRTPTYGTYLTLTFSAFFFF